MSWQQTLAWSSHRVRETLGVFAHTQAQTYELTYSVSISAKRATPITLAIPLPPNTHAQTIQDLTLHLPHTTAVRDEIFGNHILIASLEPRAETIEMPVFRCLVTTKPRGVTPPPAAPPLTLRGGRDATQTNNRLLHPDDPHIKQLAERLGQGLSASKTAARINAHLVQHLMYGDPVDGLYSDLEALTRSRVDCGGFNTLFVSLCLADNIPAHLVSGFWLDGNKNAMHAWAEFQVEDGRWIPVDPSVEQMARAGRTHKSGRFGFVGSDRLTLSVGCDIPIQWNNKLFHAPILQHPFVLDGSSDIRCRGDIHVARSPVVPAV